MAERLREAAQMISDAMDKVHACRDDLQGHHTYRNVLTFALDGMRGARRGVRFVEDEVRKELPPTGDAG